MFYKNSYVEHARIYSMGWLQANPTAEVESIIFRFFQHLIRNRAQKSIYYCLHRQQSKLSLMIEEQLLGQLQGNYELFIVPFLEKKR